MLVALYALRKSELHMDAKQATKAKFSEAFRYLRNRLDIQIVMLTVFATATFGMNFQMFNALMATREFHKGPAEFGSLGTFLAVGSLTGALLSSRIEAGRVPRRIMLGALSFGLLLAGLAFMPSYLAYSLALPFGGLVALLTLISANTYVQTTTDSKMRGRIMGIYLTVFLGGTPFVSPIIGWLAELIGIRATIVACGSVLALSALVLLLIYNTRRKRLIADTCDGPTMAIDII
jgi:MFS family permease